MQRNARKPRSIFSWGTDILFAAKRVPVFSLFIYVVAVYLNLPNIFKSGHSKMVLRQWQIASVQVLGMFTAKSIHVKQKECLSSLGPSTKGQVWKPRSEDMFILQNGPFGSKPHRSEETALECTRESKMSDNMGGDANACSPWSKGTLPAVLLGAWTKFLILCRQDRVGCSVSKGSLNPSEGPGSLQNLWSVIPSYVMDEMQSQSWTNLVNWCEGHFDCWRR